MLLPRYGGPIRHVQTDAAAGAFAWMAPRPYGAHGRHGSGPEATTVVVFDTAISSATLSIAFP